MHLAETATSSLTPEMRLLPAGLSLPKAAAAVANYEPCVISGRILYTSTSLDRWTVFKDKIGKDLTPEQGYEACKLSTLNAIAQLKSTLGELSRVVRIARLEGVLNVAPGFTDHQGPQRSDLINQIFGAAGAHTRMIYSNPEMPFNCASLVVLWAEINNPGSAQHLPL